jgi:hypothetical protein
VTAKLPPAVALLSLVGACVPALTMQDPKVHVTPSQVAIMPALVQVSELAVSGDKLRDDWTTQARRNVDAVLDAVASANGASVLRPELLDGAEVPYERFRRWSGQALIEIGLRLEGAGLEDTRSVTDWRFGPGLESWRAALRSDFVLVVRFIDAHESAGMIVANLFSTVQVHARQTGIACAVRLSNGAIVWCEHRVDPYGELRRLQDAHRAVDALVSPLLPQRQLRIHPPPPLPSAPTPPPPSQGDSVFGS